MKLSIVIPTWNRRENILRTLQCLEQQVITSTEPIKHEFEVIIVDDGSTDGTTQAIIQGTQIHVPWKVVYVHTENKEWNASIPRNIGARLTRMDSDGILFLDSDVMLPPFRIQRLIEDFERDPDQNRVIIGPYHFMNIPLQPQGEWYAGNITNYGRDIRWQSFEEHPVEEKNTGVGFALACFGGMLFIPRKLFFKTGGYDEKVNSGCEDGEFGLTLWESGAVFSMDMQLLGWHHPHEIAPSRTKDIPSMIKYIDEKHHMDLILESGNAYRQWGVDDWQPPVEWVEAGGYKKEDFNANS